MCTDKRKGSLGIKSFSKMNKALLCKCSWRSANDRNSLWRKVICNKFGETNGGWHTCDLRGGYGISLWKEIRKEWPSFIQNAVYSQGDGRRINFWKDVWCGEEALCSIYPSLFNLALNKEATIADIWDSGKGEGCWSTIERYKRWKNSYKLYAINLSALRVRSSYFGRMVGKNGCR